MDRELRYFQSGELRASEENGKRQITGYAVVYGQMSVPIFDFREVIEPGTFSGSVDGDVRALWQHESASVLGRTKAGTLRLYDDDIGLRFELDLPETQIGRDAHTSILRGDVDGMSFGFSVLPDGSEWSEDAEGTLIRTVRNAKLYEISPVTWPAYPAASVNVRNDEIYGVIPEIPAELRAQDAGDIGDEDGGDLRAQAARRERVLRLNCQL